MQRKLTEMQQKLAATPGHLRGEAHEVQLRDLLQRNFSRDRVDDVPVGAAGSDLVHRVVDDSGREAGTIVWECKNTKTWTDEWLVKLRDDQRAIGADVAVIVSAALPPDIRVFGLREGVWVASLAAAVPVATVLRRGIIDVAFARQTHSSRGEKMSLLYDYLTGPEFKNRFLGVIEAYQEMQEDLESERNAMLTIWKKRDRQLRRAIENLSSFYGDVQGIAGAQLGDLEPLALPSSGVAPAGSLAGPLGSEDLEERSIADDQWPLLVNILWELVPIDGRAVGNKSLCDQFTSAVLLKLHLVVGSREYDVCKEKLLKQGRVRRGPGKGGSVARIENVRHW